MKPRSGLRRSRRPITCSSTPSPASATIKWATKPLPKASTSLPSGSRWLRRGVSVSASTPLGAPAGADSVAWRTFSAGPLGGGSPRRHMLPGRERTSHTTWRLISWRPPAAPLGSSTLRRRASAVRAEAAVGAAADSAEPVTAAGGRKRPNALMSRYPQEWTREAGFASGARASLASTAGRRAISSSSRRSVPTRSSPARGRISSRPSQLLWERRSLGRRSPCRRLTPQPR